MSIPSGFYTDLTKNYYGVDPASQTEEEAQLSSLLWRDFLSKVAPKDDPYFNIISSTDEEEVKQALITMASSYASPLSDTYVEDISTLAHQLVTQRGTDDLSNLTSKDSSAVGVVLTNLIVPPLLLSDPFVTALLPSLASEIAADNAENQKLYFDYLSGQLDATHVREATNALSVDEATNRHITYSLIEILLTLIGLATNSQIVSAQAENPLLQKKQEYINRLKKMVFYVGKGELSESSKLSSIPAGFRSLTDDFQLHEYVIGSEDLFYTKAVYSDDPSKYTLGYGGITMQDIFNYLYDTANKEGTATYILNSSPWWADAGTMLGQSSEYGYLHNQCTLTVDKDDQGEFTITTSFAERLTTQEVYMPTEYDHTQTVPPVTSGSPESGVMDALKTTFYQAYADARTAGWVNLDSSNPTWTGDVLQDPARLKDLHIPWPYEYVEDTDTYLGLLMQKGSVDNDPGYVATASDLRSKKNKVLNSYIEANKSWMQLLSDKIDSQSQMQDTDSNLKKQTINMVQSIIRQLQNLLAAIYR